MQFEDAIQSILSIVDPALSEGLKRELANDVPGSPVVRLGEGNIVLAGHRASGKTQLSPIFGQLLSRPAVDLDALIQAATGRAVSDWVERDLRGFRQSERHFFQQIQPPAVISVGGGFLSNHSDLLEGHVPVLIPITFATYRARLLKDTTRPRLRANVSLEEEIENVFREREKQHSHVPTVSLVDFLRALRNLAKP